MPTKATRKVFFKPVSSSVIWFQFVCATAIYCSVKLRVNIQQLQTHAGINYMFHLVQLKTKRSAATKK